MEKYLEKFVTAQESGYPIALTEIKNGKKLSHWMWYIFPQIKGLGTSEISKYYSLDDLEQAGQYLMHPLLGRRLIETSETLLKVNTNNATQLLGTPDDLKLRSSMTLFAEVPNAAPVFKQVLEKFFEGKKDEKTLNILEKQK